ncbi:MAG: GLPGLI family protein, partial [Weeksellaceae bacterium]|nr:GLPGLI family protein [Weeksellaceae bacterium]
ILMSITHNNDEWILTDETKQIGDFKCFKAYKIINEKKYFAWFTEQLPLPYGPIAINGLKGIILELYNEDKTVFFEFEKFENTSELVQSYISEYDFSTAITYQEYLELKK